MRPYCNRCHYPLKTCVCKHISELTLPIKLLIIQHPKEAEHAKNTARLVTLCAPQASIVSASDGNAMEAARTLCKPNETVVLYPCEDSQPLELLDNEATSRLQQLIVIDGSWKQAYSIMQQHSWLKTIPAYHFKHTPATRYRIRHTSIEQGLSTLEATAYAVHCLFNSPYQPLLNLQEAMQSHWLGPSHHQRKVED